MNFLDEIKKQAEEAKEREFEQTRAMETEVTNNFLLAQSKLKESFKYINDLAGHLEIVNPPYSGGSFFAGDLGMVLPVKQGQYQASTTKFTHDGRDFIRTVHFKFRVHLDKPIEAVRTSSTAIDSMKEFLWRHGLSFKVDEFKNTKGVLEKAVFQISNEIPVSMDFKCDVKANEYHCIVRNFGMMGDRLCRYTPDEVSSVLWDEWAKLVAGDPTSTFKTYGQNQKQKAPPKTVLAQKPKEDENLYMEEKKSLIGQLKNLFGK